MTRIKTDNGGLPSPEVLGRLAVEVASDKLASDIQMLDISEVSGFADYFVIATVESSRQLNATKLATVALSCKIEAAN